MSRTLYSQMLLSSGNRDKEEASLFPQTRWTLVVRSGNDHEHASERALCELCEIYWQPLYIYLRRSGKSPQDAEDIVQDFFAHLVRSDFFDRADAANGKLRSFLLKSLKNFSMDLYKRDSAIKRGGGQKPLSIDQELAEHGTAIEQTAHLTPDAAFDRQWAYSVLNEALDSVRQAYVEAGKLDLFDGLSPLISWNVRSRPQREVAEELGLSDSAMRVALHRLRTKFRESIRAQVAETVAGTATDIDEEIRELFSALA